MAITLNKLTSGSAATVSSANTASISPGTNRLVLLAVASKQAAATATVPTASGNSLTYVQVATVPYRTIASSIARITLFRAMGTPTTGAITISFGGSTQDGIDWQVAEFDGVNIGGANGSSAVVQSNTMSSDGTTHPSITLSALADATNNATYGCFANNGADMTVGSGYTSIYLNDNGNFGRHTTEWKLPGSTTVDVTSASASQAGIAIEIGVAGAANVSAGLLLLGVGS